MRAQPKSKIPAAPIPKPLAPTQVTDAPIADTFIEGNNESIETGMFPEMTLLQRNVGNRVMHGSTSPMNGATSLLSRELLHKSNRANVSQRIPAVAKPLLTVPSAMIQTWRWEDGAKPTMPDAQADFTDLSTQFFAARNLWYGPGAAKSADAGTDLIVNLGEFNQNFQELQQILTDTTFASPTEQAQKTTLLANIATNIVTSTRAVNGIKTEVSMMREAESKQEAKAQAAKEAEDKAAKATADVPEVKATPTPGPRPMPAPAPFMPRPAPMPSPQQLAEQKAAADLEAKRPKPLPSPYLPSPSSARTGGSSGIHNPLDGPRPGGAEFKATGGSPSPAPAPRPAPAPAPTPTLSGPKGALNSVKSGLTSAASDGATAVGTGRSVKNAVSKGIMLGGQDEKAMADGALNPGKMTDIKEVKGTGFIATVKGFVNTIKESIFSITWVKDIIDFLQPLKDYMWLIAPLTNAYTVYSTNERYSTLKTQLDAAPPSGVDTMRSTLQYSVAKVKRALMGDIATLIKSIAKMVVRLITILTGGASAIVTESIALSLDLAQFAGSIGRKFKGVYKKIRGTKGVNRTANATHIYDGAIAGDARALKIVLDFKPWGLVAKISDAAKDLSGGLAASGSLMAGGSLEQAAALAKDGFIGTSMPATTDEVSAFLTANPTKKTSIIKEIAAKLSSK